ncbi:MAG: hypothetical protein BECKG1743D_GA0114223_109651, partial [Candidatus Kentron sp. G]
PADVKCLSLLYLYVGRYPRNNASRNTYQPLTVCVPTMNSSMALKLGHKRFVSS